jgi:hypothetical protein
MNLITSFFKKNINFSNFWFKNIFILVIISIVANHLNPENFPLNKSYKFPWLSIAISILLGSLVVIISGLNFQYFKNKYFTKKINTQVLLRFLLSTLGYISILYIPLYYGLNGLINGIESFNFFYLLIGLSITLLLCTLGMAIVFSNDIYKLHKLVSIEGILKVQQGGKTTLVKYPEIAFIHSQNKIVYIVKVDGTSITTDFTLNEIESQVSEQSFFRANRQAILHHNSIEEVKSIENGKLLIRLKPNTFDNSKISEINISRYKKQEFMKWFESKL